MAQGVSANDPFQPGLVADPSAGNAIFSADNGMAKQQKGQWELPFVRPICLQLPSISVTNIVFVAGRKIGRPFIIRGVVLTSNNPKASFYIRGGYNDRVPTSLADIAGCNNIFGIEGSVGTTAPSLQTDGYPMNIAGVLIAPIYIPVDDANSLLWASVESTAANTLSEHSVTFLCDFTPRDNW